MKKLLWIIVLGLLWSGNTSANPGDAYANKVPIGSTAKSACKIMTGLWCRGNNATLTVYYQKFQTEIWWRKENPNLFLIFKNVAAPTKFSWTNYKFNNEYYGDTGKPEEGGLLKEIFYGTLFEARLIANPDEKKQRDDYLASLKIIEEKRVMENEQKLKKEIEKRTKEEEEKKKKVYADLNKKYEKVCEKSLFKSGFKKGTIEYDDCLIKQDNIAKKIKEDQLSAKTKKEKELANKMVNMSSDERMAYNCETTFGFKKGSSNFKDCIFKLYQIESEIEKKELEVRLKTLEVEIEKQKMSIANQKPSERVIIQQSNDNAVADAMREANRIARAKALIQLGERLGRPPATSVMPFPKQQNCKLNPLNNRIVCN